MRGVIVVVVVDGIAPALCGRRGRSSSVTCGAHLAERPTSVPRDAQQEIIVTPAVNNKREKRKPPPHNPRTARHQSIAIAVSRVWLQFVVAATDSNHTAVILVPVLEYSSTMVVLGYVLEYSSTTRIAILLKVL